MEHVCKSRLTEVISKASGAIKRNASSIILALRWQRTNTFKAQSKHRHTLIALIRCRCHWLDNNKVLDFGTLKTLRDRYLQTDLIVARCRTSQQASQRMRRALIAAFSGAMSSPVLSSNGFEGNRNDLRRLLLL